MNTPSPSRQASVGSKQCGACFGTGDVLCLRSAFIGDGYRRERCGICSGTGFSSYRDSPEYIRWQRLARSRDAILRSAPRGLDYIALGALVRNAEQEAA
jgi:DnaJ-class molecular chaperone